MNSSLSPFATENWSRETGTAVPSRVSLLVSILRLNMVLTYGFLPSSAAASFHLFNRRTPSGQSRVCRVTQLRTDGVHCRESSAGTGPVNLNVIPSGCCLCKFTMDQLIYASLSHTHHWFQVGMLKVGVVYWKVSLAAYFFIQNKMKPKPIICHQ